MIVRLLARMLLVPALLGAATATATPWATDWVASGYLAAEPATARIAASPNGHLLVADEKGAMALFDADGVPRWTAVAVATMHNPSSYDTRFGEAAVDADGSAWYTATDIYDDEDQYATLSRVGADGRLLWSRPGPGARLVRVDGGAIVAGCGRTSDASIVTKIDADGQLLWQRVLPRATCSRVRLAAAPDGGAYVLQFDGSNGSYSGYTLTRIRADGVPAQSVASNAPWPHEPRVLATPDAVYVFAPGVTRLDPETLSTQWSVPSCLPYGVVPANAADGAGDLVCGRAGLLTRLDASTGQPRWSLPPGHFDTATVTADGVLLADARALRRLDLAPGAVQWSAPLPTAPGTTILGIGQPADGRFGLALSSCTPENTGCVTWFVQSAFADGTGLRYERVETAPLKLSGSVRRDGDDIAAVGTTGGTVEFVRVRVASAADGSLRWQEVHSFELGRYARASQVAFGSDFVAVAASWSMSRNGGDLPSGTDVAVYDRANGGRRWSARFTGFDERRGGALALIVDGQGNLVLGTTHAKVFDGTYETAGALRRLSASDGSVLWTAPVGAYVNDVPELRLVGGDIVANADGVSRLAVADGRYVWNSQVRPLYGMPVALPGGDIVVLGSSGGRAVVSRLAFANGNTVWQQIHGDGVRRVGALDATTRAGELVVVGTTQETGFENPRRPFVLRLDPVDGRVAGLQEPVLGAHSGTYAALAASTDSRLRVVETRRTRASSTQGAAWLTDLDASGRAVGSQGLRLTAYGNAMRQAFTMPLGPAQDGELLFGGNAVSGESAPGISMQRIDARVVADGDLAVTLDPLPALQTGRPFGYGATVSYAGDAPTTATLYLHLPWPGAGPLPTCAGIAPADCVIDGRNGWFLAQLRLDPGAVVRIVGVQTALQPEGAYLFRQQPLIEAVVVGATGLREMSIDNNLDAATRPVSLFADGFD